MSIQYTRTVALIVLLVSLFLPGCSGGGSGAGTSENTPENRESLFAEEALQRVRDRADVQCESVTCDGEGEHFTFFDATFGTLFESCQYTCMPSEIDTRGEVRHYFVKMQWDRTPDGCFGQEGEVAIFFQVTVSCVETF